MASRGPASMGRWKRRGKINFRDFSHAFDTRKTASVPGHSTQNMLAGYLASQYHMNADVDKTARSRIITSEGRGGRPWNRGVIFLI